MAVKMIIATGANFEIGQDGKLPWGYIKEDMEYFKEKTKGSVVVMGRKTYDSLPFNDGLPDRKNYVLTTNVEGLKDKKAIGINDIKVVARYYMVNQPINVWVIGGESIYRQLLRYVDEVHWTIVEDSFPEADTHFNMGFLYEGEWQFDSMIRLNDKTKVTIWKRIK